jgi:hypothetical protein
MDPAKLCALNALTENSAFSLPQAMDEKSSSIRRCRWGDRINAKRYAPR